MLDNVSASHSKAGKRRFEGHIIINAGGRFAAKQVRNKARLLDVDAVDR